MAVDVFFYNVSRFKQEFQFDFSIFRGTDRARECNSLLSLHWDSFDIFLVLLFSICILTVICIFVVMVIMPL